MVEFFFLSTIYCVAHCTIVIHNIYSLYWDFVLCFFLYVSSCDIYNINMTEQQKLLEKATTLEKNLDIQDRKWRFKTFKNCFIGSEAIKIIINLKYATNISEAIALGNAFIKHDIIKHVTRKHRFKNEHLYYKFTKTYKLMNNTNTIPEVLILFSHIIQININN